MTTIAERDVALIDLLDRLLGGGVVIAGDITLAVADVDGGEEFERGHVSTGFRSSW